MTKKQVYKKTFSKGKEKKLDAGQKIIKVITSVAMFPVMVYVFPHFLIYKGFLKIYNSTPYNLIIPLKSHAKHPAALILSFFVWYSGYHFIQSLRQ